ncbi:MAG: hypothetical protein N3F10_03335 [Candidatus Bathyarchaeota archaeon]|nr:hypothetical protein [Candidatus Bathyarchaeota archaeon]MCX8177314.1 hypothetical protein [Candidatus Bathyarchaeota archaeon]MDW8193760.1 hypothetical protein [Nitrososphaerota archaeon]
MDEIRVILCGVGDIGSAIAKHILNKKGLAIVGAVDVAREKVGKDLGEILNLDGRIGVAVQKDMESVLSEAEADVAIHSTTSYLRDAYPQLCKLVENHVNVISTCEELVYPYYVEPELSEKLDALARKCDVTVLGAGINPGFLMDTLIIALTAVCQRIEHIEAVRVVDPAKRRLSFQRKVGVGLTVDEFKSKIASGHITGHVGLVQSLTMIADALCWSIESVVADEVKPVVAEEDLGSGGVRVKAGRVAGISQRASAIINGEEVISLIFQAYVGAEEYDAVTIRGVPAIQQRIQPCINGDLGTVGIITNLIPRVLYAPAGLLSMKDIPIPSATPENLRECLSPSVRVTAR